MIKSVCLPAAPLLRSPHHQLRSLRQLNPLSWLVKEDSLSALGLHVIQHRLEKFIINLPLGRLRSLNRVVVSAEVLVVGVYLGMGSPPQLGSSHLVTLHCDGAICPLSGQRQHCHNSPNIEQESWT